MRVDGIDVAAQPSAALARMGVLSDARGLYPRLTARENIVYYGRLHGMTRAPRPTRAPRRWRDMLDMQPLLDRRTDGFSQGERMKTALARALVHDPANIVLDEPTNGLDVLATRALRDTLRRLRDEHGKCIVFSTPHHAGGGAPVRPGGGGRARPHRGRGQRRRADARAAGQADFEETFVELAFSADERGRRDRGSAA